MKKRMLGALLFCLLLSCFGGMAMAAEKHPYYVTVNLTENIVTVYEQDETGEYTVPIKAFWCSGGGYTPEGTFRTSAKYEWRPLFGDVWGQYATRITSHILFHSVPYFEKDKSTLEYEEYNKLGTTASAGCIRMAVEDVKWLYDNCPVGTTVKMYRGDVQEPLQPEPVRKIDTTDLLRRGWDPTDPDSDNPWNKGEMREMTLQVGKTRRGMTAYYEKGNYYMTAADANRMFAHLGVTLVLPADAKKVTDGTATFWYQRELRSVACHVENGTVYHKLRDLADLAGVEIHWNREEKTISLRYKTEEITFFRRTEEG